MKPKRHRGFTIQDALDPYFGKLEYIGDEYEAELIDGDWISNNFFGNANTIEEAKEAINAIVDEEEAAFAQYLQDRAMDKLREARAAYMEERA